MYPDRATFQRMTAEEPNLSGAGRQTLLALYDGPLRLRRILDIVNAPGTVTGEKIITESALRKRLDVLIARGILARAGSERTNPYYYIRRPWIFNQFALVRCRERPPEAILELTILLHELSQMAAGGDAAFPHPRYIAAAGERTERSLQIGKAYASFTKLLGNNSAIGDYLEGIYEDIYEGKVPSSDIDGLIARDFLRFVTPAPDEEREVRLFLWFSDFFHTLDRYQEAYDAFGHGIALAREQGIDFAPIVAGSRVSEGHILLHLNDLAGAKAVFMEESRRPGTGPFARAKYLFGAGEAEIVLGDLAPLQAPGRMRQALELVQVSDPGGADPDVQELRADIIRRTGTIRRLLGKFDEAGACYANAERIYRNGMPRGLAMVLAEQGELLRALAFHAPQGEAKSLLAGADRLFDEAKAASQRVRNINGFANSLIGECEVARTAFEKCRTPLPKSLDTNFANAFEIYCQISSQWGIVQTFLAEALLYHSAPDQLEERYAITADKLEQAEHFSRDLGLARELALIKRLKSGRVSGPELNPLAFL